LHFTDFSPPATPLEEQLVGLWGEVLEVKKIGVDDNFFDIGGHSLKAAALTAKIFKTFHIDLTIAHVFREKTVRGLARIISRQIAGDYLTIKPAEKHDCYPLSSAQHGIFIVRQLESRGIAYNMPGVFRVEGELDPGKLEQSLKGLIARHESLRTSFHIKDSQVAQQIHDTVEFEIEYDRSLVNCQGRGEVPSPIKVEKIIKDFIRPFDLARAPLLRVGVIRNNPGAHLLLIDIHHIICDGISVGIFLKELLAFYHGEGLEPLRLQYRDYVQWVNRESQQGYIEEQAAFWQAQFKGEVPVLKLPTDFERPLEQRFEGEAFLFHPDTDETRTLRDLARQANVTLFMLLLAIYNVFLSKLTGQEDIVVGTPTAGRRTGELSHILGMFVNTLPLRSWPGGDKSFVQFLEEIRVQTLTAFENQDCPLEKIVEKTGVQRLSSRNPLFDSMFAFQNLEPWDLEHPHLKLKPLHYIPGISKFDLTLEVREKGTNLDFNLEYSTNLFKSQTIRRFIDYFKQILSSIIANPHQNINSIDILPDYEKHQLLYDFNDTAADYPKDKLLQQLFRERAEKTPDSTVAISRAPGAGGMAITYKELNRKSRQLAQVLKENGVEADVIVGIMVERSFEMIIGLLAILTAGGAYLPVDVDYPEERIEYMLKDSGAKILLKDTNFTPGEFNKRPKGTFSHLHLPPAPAASLAYVIYTSGSTGRPRGVMVQHCSVVRLVVNNGFMDWEPGDCFLPTGSFAFDITSFETWAPLLNGVPLVLAEKSVILNGKALQRVIRANWITHLHLIPPLFDQMVTQFPSLFSTLKCFLVGGDRVNPRHLKQIRRQFPGLTILHMYGPTENTTFSTYFPVEQVPAGCLPIGKPIANSTAYILDKYDHLQPIGVMGELCVGGDGVARGYLNNPELNAQKFLPVSSGFYRSHMSYMSYIPKKIYKTGDLARWLTDGNIEFLGRMDHQVKIRGFRVELEEIEKVMSFHPRINEVVVTARKDKNNHSYLAAYYVEPQDGNQGSLQASHLHRFLAEMLPGYMIPSYFISLEKFPLTPGGKIDRRVLPEPSGAIGTQPTAQPPATPIQIQLTRIWEEVLGIRGIGIDDNFFEHGGHSLRAIDVTARIQSYYQVEFSLSTFFARPIIRDQADYIRQARVSASAGIAPVEKMDYYPVSAAQRRLFVLYQLDKDGVNYNMPGAVRIEGEISGTRMEEAFKQLVRRHESLRTSFHLIDGQPVQRVHDEAEFEMEYYGAGRRAQSAKHKAQGMEWNKERRAPDVIRYASFIRPFDLSKAPLLRAAVIKEAENKYLLLLDIHHIAADGASTGIFINQFNSLYSGRELAPPALQYKDFAVWQKIFLQSDRVKREKTYWINRFPGEIPLLALPLDFPRPAIQSFAGHTLTFVIDSLLGDGLRRLAETNDATLFMVLLAVFNILLYRYSGQEDIIIGSPAAGRTHADLNPIIGMFVNMLPMRNFLQPHQSFRDFLREVKKNSIQAFENQDYQFDQLVEELNITRDISRNPLFDIMFAFQNPESQAFFFQGTRFQLYPLEINISKFDLTLQYNEQHQGQNISVSIEYGVKLFKEETIRRLFSHFINAAAEVVKNPDVLLADIRMLSRAEEYQLLYEFNNTAAFYPADKTLHELFRRQVERTPDYIALAGGRGEGWKSKRVEGEKENALLTYKELNEKSDRFTGLLKGKGVRADMIVGIMMERSIEMIIGIWAILKAGRAYLPIDPEYPPERIEYMLKDSGARILLKKSEIRISKSETISNDQNSNDQKKANSCNVLDFETLDFEFVSNFEFRASGLKPSSLAYIIYTSGSTGRPKGVMVGHGSVVNGCTWYNRHYKITANDRGSQYASPGFDVSVLEIFPPLLVGASLFILPEEIKLDLAKINEFFETNRVTIGFLPTQLCELFMAREENHSLRLLVTAGDKLKSFVKRNYIFYNNYGPTENTVYTTAFLVERQYENIPIGKPIHNNQVYILSNDYSRLQPLGVVGELCIGGYGLARGYLNQPQLTAEKFDHDLWDYQDKSKNKKVPGKKDYMSYPSHRSYIYKTGDLARWLPDRNVEFLGRIDHQVKIRGFRIELGEIETQLSKHPKIKGAAVIHRLDPIGDPYLCAYVVVHAVSGRSGLLAELDAYLSRKVPAYMVPSCFIPVDSLPLNASGKIDRNALPEPVETRDNRIEAQLPFTRTQIQLAQTWEEVLGVGHIGIHDNFFEQGGHSLKATILISNIQERFQVEFPLSTFFARATISQQAEYIENNRKFQFEPINPGEKMEYYPLSASQRRLFTLYQLDKKEVNYNMAGALRIEGELSKSRLQEVFKGLIHRHESLRASFHFIGRQPVQRIHDTVDFEMEYYQVEVKVEEEVERELTIGRPQPAAVAVSSFIRPFDLTCAPLLRVGLIPTGIRSYILMIDMHHIISDGTSTGIIIKEFMAFYNGAELTRQRIQYKDYCLWQQEEGEKDKIKHQEEYWLRHFQGEIPVLELPYDSLRPPVQHFDGRHLDFKIDPGLIWRLHTLARQQDVTLYILLLGLYAVFLSKLSGQEDIIVGTPTAGRRHSHLHSLIGMFVNTLPIRTFPSGSKPFTVFLEELKDNILRAFENQEHPFEELVEKVLVKRDTSRNPLFDTMFAFQDPDIPQLEIPGLKVSPYPFENLTSQFDLTLQVEEIGEQFYFIFEYSTHLFKEETMQRWVTYFKQTLRSITGDPGVELADVDILPGPEKRQLLIEFNDTAADYPQDKALDQLFEEQVERTPDHSAVIGTAQLEYRTYMTHMTYISYGELNKRSSQLAYLLIEKNVGPDIIVGIMMERSVEMLMAILGILKAGGAYLPIDPGYPEERIDYMLKDSGARILLKKSEIRISKSETISNDQNSNDQKKANSCNVLDFETLDFEFASDFEFRASNLNSPNLAYIIYTSGTTGRPRGVMVAHTSVVNVLCAYGRRFGVRVGTHVLQAGDHTFDPFVEQVFGPLVHGGVVCMIPTRVLLDVREFRRFIDGHQVEVVDLVPSLHRVLLADASERRPSVRVLISGGEALDEELKERLLAIGYEVYNLYGPTETTIEALASKCSRQSVTLGAPIANMSCFVLGHYMNPLPIGVPGELCLSGVGLARGYLNQVDLTNKKFCRGELNQWDSSMIGKRSNESLIMMPRLHPETNENQHKRFAQHNGPPRRGAPGRRRQKIYMTGDLARWLKDGKIEFLGRLDFQVKVRGYRIELEEIENHLASHERVRQAVVMAWDLKNMSSKTTAIGKELVAYVVIQPAGSVSAAELKEHLRAVLPAYMVPGYFVFLEEFALTGGGKIDRKVLPGPREVVSPGERVQTPRTVLEAELLSIWQRLLGNSAIGIHDNFFDVGGNSILLVRLHMEIEKKYPGKVSATDLFTHATAAGTARFMTRDSSSASPDIGFLAMPADSRESASREIAVIGIAIRLADYDDLVSFWKDLIYGSDRIVSLTPARQKDVDALLDFSAEGPVSERSNQEYKYKEMAYLDRIDTFDSRFFRISPRDAAFIDPEQRLFLETAWRAVEDAGYGGNQLRGQRVGVFIGAESKGKYEEIAARLYPDSLEQVFAGNVKSHFAGRISYLMDWHGPAAVVDTACSSALSALHMACRSLRSGECQAALVGTVKIELLPLDMGFRSDIASADGRTRTFDNASDGTGAGEGVLALLLKPLHQAVQDKDHIYAVIKGSALNQDGQSAGLTVPNADAQADVIRNAWEDANIDPGTIGYIEAHGTGTRLGDPIEIAGLTKAFSAYTTEKQFCAVGSVKTNFGHLDNAAGMIGLVKAILCVRHGEIPPLVHFKEPNSRISFPDSPVYPADRLLEWERQGQPRRCGVSSFGLSGINCHVVVEEAPDPGTGAQVEDSSGPYLLVISGIDFPALVRWVTALQYWLASRPRAPIGSLCYTAATGRGHYNHRLALVFQTRQELEDQLYMLGSNLYPGSSGVQSFPRQGIYSHFFTIVPADVPSPPAEAVTQPDLDLLSREAAQILEQYPKDPRLTLLTRLAQLYTRGAEVDWERFYRLSRGGCHRISIPTYPFEKRRCWVQFPGGHVSGYAASSQYSRTPEQQGVFLHFQLAETPDQVVFSMSFSPRTWWLLREHRVMGQPTLVGTAYYQLLWEAARQQGITNAFEIKDLFIQTPLQVDTGGQREVLAVVATAADSTITLTVTDKARTGDTLSPPWTTYARARVQPLPKEETRQSPPAGSLDIQDIMNRCQPVEKEKLSSLNREQEPGLVQTGPRWNCLKQLWKGQDEWLGFLELDPQFQDDLTHYSLHPPLLDAALHLAVTGPGFLPMYCQSARVYQSTPAALYSYIQKKEETRGDTLQFDITLADRSGAVLAAFDNYTLKRIHQGPGLDLSRYYYLDWVETPLEKEKVSPIIGPLVVWGGSETLGEQIFEKHWEADVIRWDTVLNRPDTPDEDFYRELARQVKEKQVGNILYLEPLVELTANPRQQEEARKKVEISFYHLFRFTRALMQESVTRPLRLLVPGFNAFAVTGAETCLVPENALLVGLGKVIVQEAPNLGFHFVDLDIEPAAVMPVILEEFFSASPGTFCLSAYRQGKRYTQELASRPLPVRQDAAAAVEIKEDGVYLITGGYGGMGMEIARHLAFKKQVKLALVGRTPLPDRSLWQQVLEKNQDTKACRNIRAIRDIESAGSQVQLFSADVSDQESIKNVLEGIHRDWGPVHGIFHCAGIAGDGFLVHKDEKDFTAVLQPKVRGTRLLDRLTRQEPLDFFMLFSSQTAISGAPGQGDYTAANAFLDAYAAYRKKPGFNTLSIDWCAWQEVGMAVDYGVLEKNGIPAVRTVDALALLDRLLVHPGLPAAAAVGWELPTADNIVTAMPAPGAGGRTRDPVPMREITLEGRGSGVYSEMEIHLGRIWGHLLGYRQLNIHDNFYNLGGDSINALEIRNAIVKEMNVEVSIAEIFSHLTVARLAAFLEEKTSRSPAVPTAQTGIKAAEKRSYYPVSAAQRRLYFLWQLAPQSTAYNLPFMAIFKGKLDIARLLKALQALIHHHESLRTEFRPLGDEVVQVIKEKDEIKVPLPLTSISTGHIDKSVKSFVRPFDLSRAPLLRAELLQIDDQDHYALLVDVHHIVADAMSMKIITSNLGVFYQGIHLAAVRVHYRDFALWQEGLFLSGELEKQEQYWLRQFATPAPVLNMPLDLPRPAVQTFVGDVTGITAGSLLFSGIRRLGGEVEVTAFMVFLAGLFILFHRYSLDEDIVIAAADNGRTDPALHDMVGMFINNLPIRAFPGGNKKIKDFLREIKILVLDSFANQQYPFDQLVQQLNLPRDLSRSPLSDIYFSYMNFEQETDQVQLDKNQLVLIPSPDPIKDSSKVDMAIFAVETNQEVHFAIEYYSDIFTKPGMERLCTYYLQVLAQMVEAPSSLISDIELAPRRELLRMLESSNDTQTGYPAQKTIHKLFEEQAEQIPDYIAVVGPAQTKNRTYMTYTTHISYRELNEKADQLAGLLIEKGARPDMIVGIMMERSLEMIIGVLGILKAGGAYLPIDPEYPEDRINYMLNDSGARILLKKSEIRISKSETISNDQNSNDQKKANSWNVLDFETLDFEFRASNLNSSNLAYIIYTSGTTGRPRGVMVAHRSVVRLVKQTNFIEFSPGDRLLMTGAPAFDITTFEIWAALLNGVILYLADKETVLDPVKLEAAVTGNKITVLHLIPQLFNQIAAYSLELSRGLRYFLVGGDMMKPEYVNPLRRMHSPAKLKILHMYGPTENTTFSTFFPVDREYDFRIPIGKPVANSTAYVVSVYAEVPNFQPIGVPGELWVGGDGVSRGYLNNPELTAEKFCRWQPGGRFLVKTAPLDPPQKLLINRSHMSYRSYIYRTGDLVRWLADSNLEFLGRIDQQVKVRGIRIELEEIENQILKHPRITAAVVLARENPEGDKYLCAYIVTTGGAPDLKGYLSRFLPAYMIPSFFKELKTIPLTANGKVNKKVLTAYELDMDTDVENAPPRSHIEKTIAETWKQLLHLDKVGIHDNFFDLGGNSLNIITLNRQLKNIFKRDIAVVEMFRYTTIAAQARYLSGLNNEKTGIKQEFYGASREDSSRFSKGGRRPQPIHGQTDVVLSGHHLKKDPPDRRGQEKAVEIAVIGMAGRFPGANNIDEYWENIKNSVECITFFSDQELEAAGLDPGLLRGPNYIKAGALLEGIEYFDAPFFGYTEVEAGLMDPQVRIFHECTAAALENAGYDADSYGGAIGLYAGASSSFSWEGLAVLSGRDRALGAYISSQFTNKDLLCTRISYNLNLKGPSTAVQTACSTSLTAIHYACRALAAGQCDMALAGGVSVDIYPRRGYDFEGGILLSSDGHCRAFDARADGTIFGSGAGVVVLKPLQSACADGDHIYAVVKGTAINNDGKRKVGYTAPSVEGQAEVIGQAWQVAGVTPDTIGYIEVHGTGTHLGDPVEMAALKLASRSFPGTSPAGKHSCAVGSVKTNIGHLDAAAGVAGFIKSVMALHQQLIPPSLHFETSNPGIDFENSPFYVNTELFEWRNNGQPLRAGVSSFGIGGTNAHVILEEAPIAQSAERNAQSAGRQYQLILLSAKTQPALDKMTENLTEYLKENLLNHGNHVNPMNPGHLLNHGNHANPTNPGPILADAAYTLQTGRKAYEHRKIMVCANTQEAVAGLGTGGAETGLAGEEKPTVIFMFPGQGSQYVNMGLDLYREEPVFRYQVDRCFSILEDITGKDMKHVLYPDLCPRLPSEFPQQEESGEGQIEAISQFIYASPIKFIFEYSLCCLLMHWGIRPHAMIGHSFGEYTAACLAGVFSLEDAISLAAWRGELMHRLPPGVMLSVPLSPEELKPLLTDEISLAAVNGESLCLVSGPPRAIAALESQLNNADHECMRMRVPKAGHSRMVEPILEEFRTMIRGLKFNQPRIPYISGLTGQWITASQAADPDYWTRHLRETVRFADGLTTLFKEPNPIFVQVGPGRGLMLFANLHPDKKPGTPVLNLVRHQKDDISDVYYTLTKIGQLWLNGAAIDWQAFNDGQKRRRLPLPGYPFEKRRYWIDAKLALAAGNFPGFTPAHITGSEPVSPEAPGVEARDSTGLHPSHPVPGSKIEQQITHIWQEVLGVESVGIHENFFRLGGDSLLALHVISRLNRAFAVKLSPHALLENPTIAAVSQLITPSKKLERPSSLVVEIQRGSSRQYPIFLVHPVGGTVYFYRDLAGAMGEEYPVYGIQAAGVERDEEPLNRVESMAARYIREMCTIQARGPYHLGGSSFGGMVAFEMARQLQTRGEETALLFMIDTPGGNYMPEKLRDEVEILEYFFSQWQKDMSISAGQIREMSQEELVRFIRENSTRAHQENQSPEAIQEQLNRLVRVFKANSQAMFDYVPREYPGKLVFFRAARHIAPYVRSPELCWVPLAIKGIDIHTVPGDHITMNDPPNVDAVARVLKNQYTPGR